MSVEPRVQEKVYEVSEYLKKDKSGQVIVPVDLGEILQKYSLKAYDSTFKRDDVAGAFNRNKKEIYLNKTDPQTKKMFTLAHELGHYFLHSDLSADILYREANNHDQQEREADHFAAALLMPEGTIRLYWPVAESMQQLAEMFGVSYPAMLNRLRDLKYI